MGFGLYSNATNLLLITIGGYTVITSYSIHYTKLYDGTTTGLQR